MRSGRPLLFAMTILAVIGDSLLRPFYPQYFAQVFGVVDPRHIGAYAAASSLIVLLAFPIWAVVARRIATPPLLVATQLITGALTLVCGAVASLTAFWIASIAMLACKASYLLIYPYVLSLEPKERHLGAISTLAFVGYFGNIIAALLAGLVLEVMDPTSLFTAMAVGDALQIALCVYLWRRVAPQPVEHGAETSALAPRFLIKLGAVMLVVYFSAYVSEPFFSVYWQRMAASDRPLIAGAVFALPGIAAVFALWRNTRRGGALGSGLGVAIALGALGLMLQTTGHPVAIIAGRLGFGWALFQVLVHLDVVLFHASSPDSYAVDFSKANLFQSLGVLLASYASGGLAAACGPRVPFIVACAGLVAGGLLYLALFRARDRAAPSAASATLPAAVGGS